MSLNVVWYASSGLRPWEKKVLLDLAEALAPAVASLKVYAADAQGWEGAFSVLSWKNRDLLSLGRTLFTEGRLWHFWGQAPSWARALALRAGVVHTQWRDFGPWRGSMSTMLPVSPEGGAARLSPLFRSRSLWLSEEGTSPSAGGEPLAILALPMGRSLPDWSDGLHLTPVPLGSDARGERRGLLEREILSRWRERGGALLLPWVTADLAWLAVHGALLGVPTLARRSSFLDECLGSEGYVAVRGSDDVGWRSALEASGDPDGPPAAAAARRWVEGRFSGPTAVDRLLALYGQIVEASR